MLLSLHVFYSIIFEGAVVTFE